MNFPTGVIYIWTGTHANIPSGWERVTALDGLYPKGTADATDPNDTGGASTHEHTSDEHTHTMANHTHNVALPATTTADSGDDADGTGLVARNKHSHASKATDNPSSVSIGNTAVTYSAFSNDPPYYTVIFITPTSGKQHFPQNAVYLYDSSDSKTGHYLCDGSNSTPNLVDKYLKGAGTGADAGGTGGSTTNVHDIDHAHTVSHNHAYTSNNPSDTVSTATNDNRAGTHTHTFNVSTDTTATGTTAIELTPTETVEPAYTKLLAVQNQTTGEDSYRLGMMGMWLGTLASIPENYILCNGTNGTQDLRGRHLKLTATTGDIGSTGGSNTHTHAAQAHGHGSISHLHSTGTISHTTAVYGMGNGSAKRGEVTTATHASSNSSSTNYDLDNAGTTGASSSNEPEYRTVAFIKLNSLSGGGAMLMNFL